MNTKLGLVSPRLRRRVTGSTNIATHKVVPGSKPFRRKALTARLESKSSPGGGIPSPNVSSKQWTMGAQYKPHMHARRVVRRRSAGSGPPTRTQRKRSKGQTHLKWQHVKAKAVPKHLRHRTGLQTTKLKTVPGPLTEPDKVVGYLRNHLRNHTGFKYFRKFFTRLDTNGSGLISQDELMQGLSEMYPGITPKQVAGVYKMVQAYKVAPRPKPPQLGGRKITAAATNKKLSNVARAPRKRQLQGHAEAGAALCFQGTTDTSIWPPSATTTASSGPQQDEGEDAVPFEQFFEFLLDRQTQGDVFDPWVIEYDSDEDFHDKRRQLPIFLRCKADRERDFPEVIRKMTAQQAIDMLLTKVREKGALKLFKAFDADHSGTVTAKEFRQALKRLGVGVVDKHIDALISSIDKDHDGEISVQEFLEFTEDLSGETAAAARRGLNVATPPPGATMSGNAHHKLHEAPVVKQLHDIAVACPEVLVSFPRTHREVKDMFLQLDADGSGFVPTSKLSEALKTKYPASKGAAGLPEEHLKALMSLCDTNADGFVQMADMQQLAYGLHAAATSAGPLMMSPKKRSEAAAVLALPKIGDVSDSDDEDSHLISVADLDNGVDRISVAASEAAGVAVTGGKRAGKSTHHDFKPTAPAFITQLTTRTAIQPPHLRDAVDTLISPRPTLEARAHAHDVMVGRTHIAPTRTLPSAQERVFLSGPEAEHKVRATARQISPRPPRSARSRRFARGSMRSPRYTDTRHTVLPTDSSPMFMGDAVAERYTTASGSMSARVQASYDKYHHEIRVNKSRLAGNLKQNAMRAALPASR